MNYFGHAAVASWTSAAPGFVLGAMIPDFQTMSGARLASTPDADVAAGVALHHVTDARFHLLPAVVALMRELDAHLDARGCARGPRRAVAHIGVELLLDGALVGEPAYREAYVRGLAYDAELAWRDPGDAARFAALLARLRAYGVPDDLRDPSAIALRLGRLLARRPRLAPSPGDLRAIEAALVAHRARVVVAAPAVVRALRAAMELDQRGGRT